MIETEYHNMLLKYGLTSIDVSVEAIDVSTGAGIKKFMPGRYSVIANRGADLSVSVRDSYSDPEKILGVISRVMDTLEEQT